MASTPLNSSRWTLPSKAAGFHVRKGQIRPCKPRGVAGVLLPSSDDDVAIERIALDGPAMPPGLLGGNDRRARAGKRIEDDGTAPGHVPNRIGHERRRLCWGMQRKIVARRQTADRRRFPDVGPAAAVLTRFETIGLNRVATLEHQHELVAAAVKATLRCARRPALSPYDDVLKRKPHFTACRDQLVEVPPMHEYEQGGTALRVFLAVLQESREKGDELVCGHFGRGRRDVPLADAIEGGAIVLDRNVGWRVGQDEIRLLSLEQKLVAGRITSIATHEAVRAKDPQIAGP
jgi:hypothetical protein